MSQGRGGTAEAPGKLVTLSLDWPSHPEAEKKIPRAVSPVRESRMCGGLSFPPPGLCNDLVLVLKAGQNRGRESGKEPM